MPELCDNCFLIPFLRYQPKLQTRLERIKDKVLKDFLFLDDEDISYLSSKKIRTIINLENLAIHELDAMRDSKDLEVSSYLNLRFYVMWNAVNQPHYADIESMTQDEFLNLDRKSIEGAFLQMDKTCPLSSVISVTTVDVSAVSDQPPALLLESPTTPLCDQQSTTTSLSDCYQNQNDEKTTTEINVNWGAVGKEVGLKIWRIDSKNENGVRKFGINPWPKKLYGQFFVKDSYIILSTTKEEDKEGDKKEALCFDVFFWIGSLSNKDECEIIANKTNELDDLLNDASIQHRELQYHESNQFLDLFDKSVNYLNRGFSERFRETVEEEDETIPTRLFHIRRTNRHTRCVQVPVSCDSLNQGDAFVLDAGDVVYTWFGLQASSFEKSAAGALSHNLAYGVGRKVTRQESDVDDDNEEFWTLLGGKGEIMEEDDARIVEVPEVEQHDPIMFEISDDVDEPNIKEVSPVHNSSLTSSNTYLIDIGTTVFIWVGSASNKGENAMQTVKTYFLRFKSDRQTNIIRILEGQEKRVVDWPI